MKDLLQILLLVISASLFTGCAGQAKPEKHLFILSGQSNMTGGLKKGFTQTVEKELGSENVDVVMSMKSGRGIRFWVKDYQYARGKTLKKSSSNGEEYPKLLKTAKDALNQQDYDTVSFIWMQGESDANSQYGLSKVYDINFNKLYNHLKADLDLEKIHFVIGRISNYGLMKNQKGYSPERAARWHEVRSAQVKVAKNHKDGTWIDTDDLIDERNIHYLGENPRILGERFAGKAISLLVDKYGNEILRNKVDLLEKGGFK